MATILELNSTIQNAERMSDNDIDLLVVHSDVSNHKQFFGKDKETSKELVKAVAVFIVNRVLNNPDHNAVPIRTKTRWLLLLNNLALYKPVRGKVFDAVKNMDSIFEDAMKKEGTMPFDSELGRMSEHVLVLLMRVTNYKFKAAAVNEFAEGNTQFGVQLLLAILLKEPPYEFELRCNCISGLLGFTQPQAFFSPGDAIEFNSCNTFNEKVDFILSLCMRLSAVQVVNDVITPQLLDSPTVQPIVHLAVTNMMRMIMNVFQFATQGSTQWRQHILLSTSFVDGVTILYLQSQLRSLESLLTVAMANSSPALPPELIPGISLSLKFMGFATFHTGQHGAAIRPLCAFIHDLLTLPVGAYASNPSLTTGLVSLYTNLFHFICNIDALAGDEQCVAELDELIPELRSKQLEATLTSFINNEVAAGGLPALEKWHSKFFSIDQDALVSQDSRTFQVIDGIFQAAKKANTTTKAPAPAPSQAAVSRLLGDVSQLQAPKVKKPTDEAIVVKMVAPTKSSSVSGFAADTQTDAAFKCALNGHTMKCPVTSPYGHTYEKETIETWIRQNGSICPLTGKPLSLTDLKVNKELQAQIMQAVVQQSMALENQEDAVDLYEF